MSYNMMQLPVYKMLRTLIMIQTVSQPIIGIFLRALSLPLPCSSLLATVQQPAAVTRCCRGPEPRSTK
ncbi:uncharacterized protein BDV14DRAFT_167380 [Aspergillus stella-maris]|uniref:uncharacterized protein n=1 Tax=Aspergillus stella-maris TaxID=1810926 RepID=UPI003CCDD29F